MRFLLRTILALAILTAFAVGVVALLVPTDFVRDQAIALVREKTGRTLEVRGGSSFTVFPSVGVALKDVILSNPPYVDAESMQALPAEYRHEPGHALAAGADGLLIVERILAGAGRHLQPDGLLVVEVGSGAARLEERFPRTPFTWLVFSEADVDVFCLAAPDLPVAPG